MNIGDFRKQYPMYGDISDQDLATSLYSQFYSDMDENEFLSQFMPVPDSVFGEIQNDATNIDITAEEINNPPERELPRMIDDPDPVFAGDPWATDVSRYGSTPRFMESEGLDIDPDIAADAFRRTGEAQQAYAESGRSDLQAWLTARKAPAQSFLGGLMQQGGEALEFIGDKFDALDPVSRLMSDPELSARLQEEDPDLFARVSEINTGMQGVRDSFFDNPEMAKAAGWLIDRAEINRQIGALGAPEQDALKVLYNGAGAIPDMVFEIAGGVLGGSPVALTTMYGRIYLDELNRSKQIEGLSLEEAHMNANVAAMAEVLPEIPVFNKLFAKVPGAKAGMKDAIKILFMEGGSEAVTELINIADETLRQGKEFNWDESVKRVLMSAGEGGVMGLGMGGGGVAAAKAGELYGQIPMVRDARDQQDLDTFLDRTSGLGLMAATDVLDPEKNQSHQMRYNEAPSGGAMPLFDSAFNQAAKDMDADFAASVPAPPPLQSPAEQVDPFDGFDTPVPLETAETPFEELDDSEEIGAFLDRQVGPNQPVTAAAPLMGGEAMPQQPEAPIRIPHGSRGAFIEGLISPENVVTDAEAYQYKTDNIDAEGVNQSLAGVTKWNPDASGMMMFHDRLDGTRAVVDGHQRLGLAKRLKDQDPTLTGIVYREEDGFTREDVRTFAAVINIAQNTGSVMDAAQIIRDVNEIGEVGGITSESLAEILPSSGAITKHAPGVAKLGEDAFMALRNEVIKPEYGAIIGERYQDPAQQMSAIDALAKTKPETMFQANDILDQMDAAGFSEGQADIFGDTIADNFFKERAKIVETVGRRAKNTRSLHEGLVRNEGKIKGTGKNRVDTKTNKKIVAQQDTMLSQIGVLTRSAQEINNVLNEQAKLIGSGQSTLRASAAVVERTITDYLERGGPIPEAQPAVPAGGTADVQTSSVRQVDFRGTGVEADTGRQELAPNARFIEKSDDTFDKASTQINLPEGDAAQVLSFGQSIPNSEINEAEGGRETDVHATVLYGIKSNDHQQVARALEGAGALDLELGKTKVFEQDDYDVLVAEVKSEDLAAANQTLRDSVEYENDYDDYKPHVTIAYLNKGEGQKYVGRTDLEGLKVSSPEVVFSGTNGERYGIDTSAPDQQQAAMFKRGDPVEGSGEHLLGRTVEHPEFGTLNVLMAKAAEGYAIVDNDGAPLNYAGDLSKRMSEKEFLKQDNLHSSESTGSRDGDLELQEMMRRAARTKPAYDRMLAAGAKLSGGQIMSAPLKKNKKSAAKIRNDYHGNVDQISDILRGTIIVAKPEDVQTGIDALIAYVRKTDGIELPYSNSYRNDWADLDTDNMFGTEYRDGMIKFVMKDSRGNETIVEVQFNIPEMMEAKEKAHVYYDEGIALRHEGVKSGFTDEIYGELDELARKQREVYRPVADKYRDQPLDLPLDLSLMRASNPRRPISVELSENADSSGKGVGSGVNRVASLADIDATTGQPSKSTNIASEGSESSDKSLSAIEPSIAEVTPARKDKEEYRPPDRISYFIKHLGLLRESMPQISSKLRAEFLRYLLDKGVTSGEVQFPVKKLNATQMEFNETSVDRMMGFTAEQLDSMPPIIIDRKGFVLDGHHRLIVAKRKDPAGTIRAIQVNEDMFPLLRLATQWEHTQFKSVSEVRTGPFVKLKRSAIIETGKPGTKGARETEASRAVSKAVGAAVGQALKDNAYLQVRPGDSIKGQIRAIKKVFGKRVVVIRKNNDVVPGFEGVVFDGNTIYVNETLQNPFTATVFHELLHQMRTERPDLYRHLSSIALMSTSQERFDMFRGLMNNMTDVRGENRLSNDSVFEELLADTVADAFLDPMFLQTLAHRSPSRFKELMDTILEYLNNLMSEMRGKDMGTGQFYRDVEGLRDTMADVFAEYAIETEGKEAGEAKFKREDGSAIDYTLPENKDKRGEVEADALLDSIKEGKPRKTATDYNLPENKEEDRDTVEADVLLQIKAFNDKMPKHSLFQIPTWELGEEIDPKDIHFSFGGVNANTANMDKYHKALESFRDAPDGGISFDVMGSKARKIWKDTGWFMMPDHQWRFEISDADAEMKRSKEAPWAKENFRANQINTGAQEKSVFLPGLFNAYPALKGVLLELDHEMDAEGSFVQSENALYATESHKIKLADRRRPRVQEDKSLEDESAYTALSILLHENTHAVQQTQERFAQGGSPNDFSILDTAKKSLVAQRLQELLTSDYAVDLERAHKALKGAAEGAETKTAVAELKKLKDDNASGYRQISSALNKYRNNAGEMDFATAKQAVMALERESFTPYESYQRLHGEAEARMVQKRFGRSDAKNAKIYPLDDLDVPAGELIVRFQRSQPGLLAEPTGKEQTKAAQKKVDDRLKGRDRQLVDVEDGAGDLFSQDPTTKGQMALFQRTTPERAKAQGFTKELFHGTHSDIEAFGLGHGLGVHLGTSEQANNRLETRRGQEPTKLVEGENVMPVVVRLGKVMEMHDTMWEDSLRVFPDLQKALPAEEAKSLKAVVEKQSKSGMVQKWNKRSAGKPYAEAMDEWLDSEDNKSLLREINKVMQELGYGSIRYTNEIDSRQLLAKVWQSYPKEYWALRKQTDPMRAEARQRRGDWVEESPEREKDWPDPWEPPLWRPGEESKYNELVKKERAIQEKHIDDSGIHSYLILNPVDIRSVNAKFDPAKADSPNLSFQRSAQTGHFDSWTLPSMTLKQALHDDSLKFWQKLDQGTRKVRMDARQELQDRMIPIRRVIEAIESGGGAVSDFMNAYERESLIYGRVGDRFEQLERNVLEPMLKLAARSGITNAEIGEYLYALHAPARNAMIVKRDPSNSSGSGMSDTEAAEVVETVESGPKARTYKRLVEYVRKITDETRQNYADYDLLMPEVLESWEQETDFNKTYVPLKGWEKAPEDEGFGSTGKGLDIRGDEVRRALGRKSRPSDILSNITADYKAALIRGEKNSIGRGLYEMAQANPNPDLWEIGTFKMRKELDKKTGMVVERINLGEIRNSNEVFMLKIDGKAKWVRLKDKRLQKSMKNLGAEQLDVVTRQFARLNRWLSVANTMYNPEFLVSNFAKDIQTAAIRLTAEEMREVRSKAIGFKPISKSISAMFMELSDRSTGQSEYAKYARDFKADGAHTDYFRQMSIEQYAKNMDNMLSLYQDSLWGKTRRGGKAIKSLVEDANGAVENGVRLSTYIELRKAGASRQKAASAAKNLTVNFNRKGVKGALINSYYLFANAGIQGVHLAAQTLRTKTGRKVWAGVGLAGAMGALFNQLMGGEDDDGVPFFEKLSDYERERNWIIMIPPEVIEYLSESNVPFLQKVIKDGRDTGGRYIKFPLPWVYNIPYVMGDAFVSTTMFGESPTSAAKRTILAINNSVNPLGDNSIMGTLLPTPLDPAWQISENQNFWGGSIYREKFPGDNSPESSDSFHGVAPIWKEMAKRLNEAGGGDQWRSSDWGTDFHPETLRHWFQFFTGGAGAFVNRVGENVSAALYGTNIPGVSGDEPLRPEKAIYLRKVYGRVWKGADSSQYYEHKDQIGALEDEMKDRKEMAKTGADGAKIYSDFMMENRDMLGTGTYKKVPKRCVYRGSGMITQLKAADCQLRALRKDRKALRLMEPTKKVKDRIRSTEDRMLEIQRAFNKRYNDKYLDNGWLRKLMEEQDV